MAVDEQRQRRLAEAQARGNDYQRKNPMSSNADSRKQHRRATVKRYAGDAVGTALAATPGAEEAAPVAYEYASKNKQAAKQDPVQHAADYFSTGSQGRGKQTRGASRRSSGKVSRSQGTPRTASRGPVAMGTNSGSHVSVLQAELVTCLVLVGLGIFIDPDASTDYASVMLAAMKRGTLIMICFFILGMIASGGASAAKFAKLFGVLIVLGTAFTATGNGVITALDSFVKGNWSGTAGSSDKAQAGVQNSVTGDSIGSVISGAGQEVTNAAGTVASDSSAYSTAVSSNPFLSGNTLESLAGIVSDPVSSAANALHTIGKFFGF